MQSEEAPETKEEDNVEQEPEKETVEASPKEAPPETNVDEESPPTATAPSGPPKEPPPEIPEEPIVEEEEAPTEAPKEEPKEEPKPKEPEPEPEEAPPEPEEPVPLSEKELNSIRYKEQKEECREILTLVLAQYPKTYKDAVSEIRDRISRDYNNPPLAHTWTQLTTLVKPGLQLLLSEGYDVRIGKDMIRSGMIACLRANYVAPGPKPGADFYLSPSDTSKTDQWGKRQHPVVRPHMRAKKKQKVHPVKPSRGPDSAHWKRVAARKKLRTIKDAKQAEKLEELRKQEASK